MVAILSPTGLHDAAAILAKALDECGIEYGIIGGAGVFLLSQTYLLNARAIADIDVIVHPDPTKNISADSIPQTLMTKFPEKFVTMDQSGVSTLAIPIQRGNQRILVGVEMFDVKAYPNRPQYNLRSPSNTRTPVQINGRTVYVLNAPWLLREKILSQAQREGSAKEHSDIADIDNILVTVDDHALTFEEDGLIAALERLLEKRPHLEDELKRTINCSSVFF